MSSESPKVYANDSYGFVGWYGQLIRVDAGDEWDLDHEFVQANPHMFTGAKLVEEVVEPEPPAPKKRGGRRA
jgi:hypothetical protein